METHWLCFVSKVEQLQHPWALGDVAIETQLVEAQIRALGHETVTSVLRTKLSISVAEIITKKKIDPFLRNWIILSSTMSQPASFLLIKALP